MIFLHLFRAIPCVRRRLVQVTRDIRRERREEREAARYRARLMDQYIRAKTAGEARRILFALIDDEFGP